MTQPTPQLEYATPPFGGRSPEALWWWGLIRRLMWCLLGMILLSILIFVFALGSRLLLNWALPIATLLVIIASYSALRIRQQRVTVVLGYLEQAVRLNYPLVPWLEAAVASERGAVRRRLLKLIDVLRHGVGVADAITLTVPEAGERQLAVLRAAERAGRLHDGLVHLTRRAPQRAVDDVVNRAFSVAYPLVVGLMIFGIMGLVMIFVIPKFEQILMDFNLKMPWVTQVMLQVGRGVGLPMALIAMVVFVAVVGKAFERMFHVIPVTSPPWRPLGDWWKWTIPPWRQLVRPRQMADLCTAVASGLENGMPFERAVGEASIVATNRALGARVKRWVRRLIAGQGPHEAARDAGMPPILVSMLATAVQEDQAQQVMRFLARYYETRYSRLIPLLHAAVIPVLTLIGGGFVLLVVAGLFLPMVEMIDNLSLTTGF